MKKWVTTSVTKLDSYQEIKFCDTSCNLFVM